MSSGLIFWIIAPLAVLIIGFIVVFLLRRKLRKVGDVSHSLGLGLLQIQLPHAKRKEGEKNNIAELREKIGMMEQVYSQLGTIRDTPIRAWFYGKPFFSLELAVPHVGQEVLFYLAVPRRYLNSAEKLVHGIYPDAHIERVQDYTIFHPHGEASAARIYSSSRYLPLRSYQELEADPLGGILNAFSKVTHEGEGIALQMICFKAPESWHEKLRNIASHIKQGKDLQAAIRESGKTTLQKSLEKEKTAQELQKQTTTASDEATIRAIESKASKPLFETNIRVVACAPTKVRADALLQEVATPFSQLGRQGINNFNIRAEAGRSLQKLIYHYSFRLPQWSYRSVLSSEELSSLVHFPNTDIGATNIATLKAKIAPVPTNSPTQGLLLGENIYRGTNTKIFMNEEDRARHFYIIGQTGTGKTYFMRNQIIQDIEAGHGVCFIDPHGDTAEEILGAIPPSRIKDVIYFNPGDVSRPMGLNMLEYDPQFPEQKTFIINELLEIFNKLYDMKTAGGPMFEQYFRNATALVMDDPASGNTLLEINRVFVDKAFRDYKLSKTTNPLVQTFWRDVAEKAGGDAALQNIVPYISSKFDSFLSNEVMRPIVSQEKSAFKVREIMDNQKILLINLSKGRLGELNSSLIGLIMVGKILMSAFSRVNLPESERKTFYLYLDEFQNISTNSIESILSEARKYKLGLIIAHQFIGQLTEEIKKAVFGNVGSMAAFRVGSEDAEFLEKQFAPTFSANDLINVSNRNCFVRMLINGQTAPAFSMQTLKGKDSSAEVLEAAMAYSRMHYGRDRAEVEVEMMKKFAALEKPRPAFMAPKA